jgi:ribosomal protein L15
MRPASRDLILRIAKKRGFRNKPITEKPFIIDIASLVSKVKAFSQGNKPVVVDKETLKQIDLLPKGYAGVVKILGKGEISFPVRIEGMKVSEGIKAAVEKAGGSIA